jgi:hydroxymethylpyrimidine pyrophosphatase-like HAD family hydrolase
MGNAALGVQKKADWVTDTLEQDGIQKAFKKLHVIE